MCIYVRKFAHTQKQQEVEAPADVQTIAITPLQQQQQPPPPVETPIVELSVQHEEEMYDTHYQHLVGLSDEVREEKINSVVKLSCWIRSYLWFGFLITLLATLFACIGSVLPCIFYIFGLIGARKLNKCLLAFPIILTAVVGFGGLTVNVIWFYDLHQLIAIAISVLHIIIFACICKLVVKIAELNKTEYKQARARIIARSCCC